MKIIGTGSALPKTIVTNQELADIVDTSDEWIRSRTGIGSRHIAMEETTAGMASEAAKRALQDAGVLPEELDLILAATLSADYVIPMLSCQVQEELGAKNAVAFDVSAACSGFLFALATADAYMGTGKVKKALIIGAETLSRLMDWKDRSTCVLFGDGAGAVVAVSDGDHLRSMVQGSDGSAGMALSCKNRTGEHPFREAFGEESYGQAGCGGEAVREEPAGGEISPEQGCVRMDGQAVYRFAVRTVPLAIGQALEEANLTADDISLFVLHQANLRILEAVAKRLKQPMEKFPTNLEECGNVSAASVPILLDKLCRENRIQPGDNIVLSGFGAGLTWGACVITW